MHAGSRINSIGTTGIATCGRSFIGLFDRIEGMRMLTWQSMTGGIGSMVACHDRELKLG